MESTLVVRDPCGGHIGSGKTVYNDNLMEAQLRNIAADVLNASDGLIACVCCHESRNLQKLLDTELFRFLRLSTYGVNPILDSAAASGHVTCDHCGYKMRHDTSVILVNHRPKVWQERSVDPHPIDNSFSLCPGCADDTPLSERLLTLGNPENARKPQQIFPSFAVFRNAFRHVT